MSDGAFEVTAGDAAPQLEAPGLNGARQACSVMPISGAPWKGVVYGCTTRHGGVSTGPWQDFNLGTHVNDVPEHVALNRRRLVEIGGLPSEPFWLDQVHGVNVADADLVPEQLSGQLPRADAAVTETPGKVLAIMTADCVPVVVSDVEGTVLGAAHAGWRGLVTGVVDTMLAALRTKRPTASSWRAWVGPCIGQAAFEVGEDVRAAFLRADPATAVFFIPGRADGKWHADLAGLTRHRLLSSGVATVEIAGLCTHDRDDLFFSYRRHSITGRMATLAWLDPLPTFPD